MSLKEELLREQKRLEAITKSVQKNLSDEPEGFLRISVDKKNPRYYHCISDKFGKYIPKSDTELPQKLAQKSYDEKVLSVASKRLKQIKKITKDLVEQEIDGLFDNLHPVRKKLVIPVEKTIAQKYEEWLNAEYQGKGFKEGIPEIYTEKGERVRSKSEKIIADYLYRRGIEYKYEKPLRLNRYGIVYPDFTFFSMKTGEEIYWEHDGRMDDPGYARNAIRKIEWYESDEIYIGERLIITFETSEKVLNTNEIERVVRRYLI